jgi:hypothetical protein
MFAALRSPLAAAALLLAFGAVSTAPLVALACPMATPAEQSTPPCHGDPDEAPVKAPMLCCLAAPTDAATTLAPSVTPEAPASTLAAACVDVPTPPVATRHAASNAGSAPPPGQTLHLTTRLLI